MTQRICVAPCKVIQESLGFPAVDSGFHVRGFRIPHLLILDSIGGWIQDFKVLFWIPDSISWIPDSKAVDSLSHRLKLPGIRITHGAICAQVQFIIQPQLVTQHGIINTFIINRSGKEGHKKPQGLYEMDLLSPRI